MRTLRHAVTKFRISLHVHQASFAADRAESTQKLPSPWRWVSLDQMKSLPMSVTGRKIVDFLADDSQSFLPFS